MPMRALLLKIKGMSKEEWLAFWKKAGLFLLPYLALLAISFLPLIAWWRESETIPTGQDITWHLAWVYDLVFGWRNGFYGLTPGHNLLGNLGYNVFLFYGSFAHQCVGVLALMGMRIIDAWRLVGLLSVFLSGCWCYHLGLLLTKSKPLAIALGALFILLPYRYTDFLVRTAYSEGVALGFVPLLFLGVFHILKDEEVRVRGYIYSILGTAGLILSHPFTAFLTGIAAVAVVLANYKDVWRIIKKPKTWIYLALSLFLLFCLVGFYLIPMALALDSGIYRVSDEQKTYLRTLKIPSRKSDAKE